MEMSNGLFAKLKRFMINWLARRLPDCKSMTRKLSESIDRTPRWREALVMKLHLFTCDACERYLGQIKFLKQAVHAHGDLASRDPRLPESSKERMRSVLRARL